MVGITSYGAYVPLLRLDREVIGGRGERAVCNFDEDSVTMGVAAAMDCLKGTNRKTVDGIYFASTTSPYKEKLTAPIVSLGTDLRRDIVSADFANSLRAGTTALMSAIDAVGSGSAKSLLVVAADSRIGKPGSALEQNFGDGAGALLVGDTDVAVSMEARYSVCDEILDVWRLNDDLFVRSWEERFSASQGCLSVVHEAVSGLMERFGYRTKDFSKVVFNAPDSRRCMHLAGSLGFEPGQIQDPLFDIMGNTGTAFPLMLLVAALEEAKVGDRILLTGYGNGCDCIVLKVHEPIENIRERRGMSMHLSSKKVISDYLRYLDLRNLIPRESGAKQVTYFSAPAAWRERDANLRLQGSRCSACGTVQYPPQRVCVECQSKDQSESYRLAEKRGKIFTYVMDYIEPTPDIPTVTTEVDFQGGGRMECYMTDREVREICIDMPVEMTFRKLCVKDGAHIYFWKSMPVRI